MNLNDDDDILIEESPAAAFDRNLRHRASAVYNETTSRVRLPITSRLWLTLAGVEHNTLALCPWEAPKYVALGAAILLSSTLAGVAMFIGLTYAMEPLHTPLIAFISAVWALMVLILDRFLVSVSVMHGGGGPSRLLAVVPRLALALFIGLAVSEPLVISVFDREIDAHLAISDAQYRAKLGATTEAAEAKVAEANARLAQARDAYIREIQGSESAGTTGAPGLGPVAQHRAQQVRQLEEERALRLGELAREQQELDALRRVQPSHGILDRINALSELQARNPAMKWARTALSGCLVLVEALPALLFALLAFRRDAYQRLLAHRETLVLEEASRDLAKRRMEIELEGLARQTSSREPGRPT